MKRMRFWFPVFMVLSLLLSAIGNAAAGNTKGGNAYGTAEPYGLSLQALLGKDNATDLYLTANPAPGYAPPDTLKKVQLKSFTLDGKLAYTRNFKDVTSPSGQGKLRLTDVTRGQPVQALVAVQNAQTVSEVILRGETQVLLRPDLTVNQVKAPANGTVNVPIPVNVLLQELNGDLGANARVEISRGGTVLDQVDEVSVEAGATAALGFRLTFAQPGSYTLTVRIADVAPGDYDLSNNTVTFTLDIASAPSEEYYFNSYYWYADDDQNDWDVYHAGETEPFMHTHKQTTEDMFSLVLNTKDATQTDFADEVSLTLTSETGASKVMTISGITGPGVYLLNGDSMNGVQVFNFPTYSALYVWSYGGRWTMSQNFLNATSAPYTSTGGTGEILGGRERVTVKLDLTDGTGTHTNGYTLDLSPQTYTYDTWYENTWDNTRTHWTIYRHFYGGTGSGYLAF